MSYYGQRFPFNQVLQQTVDYQIQSALQNNGWSLPCQVKAVSPDGLFVTVSILVNNLSGIFTDITIPIMESQYVRIPVQVGDVGVTRKADVSLYHVSGQKPGSPNFGQDGNYEALLAFEPVAVKGMPPNGDINATWIYGPDGVTLQDLHLDGSGNPVTNSKIVISQSSVRMQSGSSYIQINKDGTIVIQGSAVTIMGKDFLGHVHGGVQSGPSNTTGVA